MNGIDLQFWQVWRHLPALLDGAWLTLGLSLNAATAGGLLAFAGVYALRSGSPFFASIARAFVEVFRNTPFLVQLFFLYFSLAHAGWRITANQAAILTMTLNFAGYSIEILRGGMEAIPRQQIEASRILGMTRFQTFVYVIVPQTLRNTFPSMTSQLSLLILASRPARGDFRRRGCAASQGSAGASSRGDPRGDFAPPP
jgi:polar amino acid transport system permease protein